MNLVNFPKKPFSYHPKYNFISRLLQGGFDFCFQLLLTGKNNNILYVLYIVKKAFWNVFKNNSAEINTSQFFK